MELIGFVFDPLFTQNIFFWQIVLFAFVHTKTTVNEHCKQLYVHKRKKERGDISYYRPVAQEGTYIKTILRELPLRYLLLLPLSTLKRLDGIKVNIVEKSCCHQLRYRSVF